MNLNSHTPEPKIKFRKQMFGLSYGLAAGLAFSITLWGLDGYQLSRAYAYLPWTKFITGGALAMLVCGFAGWLTSRLEKPLLGVFLWIAAAGVLAWLTILVPVVIAPAAMKLLVPELQPFLHYTFHANSEEMAGAAFAWILIASFIIAAIQVPMIEQATFSISIFGQIAPHLICAFLMLVSGSVTDNLNNKPLRDPLLSMNDTIQFTLDNKGKEVDTKVARELHLASLRPVQDLITAERRMVVSRFDSLLENVTILINFDGNWVECGTSFAHPLNCKAINP